MDRCKNCGRRGDLIKCLDFSCSLNTTWLVKALQSQIGNMQKVVDAVGEWKEGWCDAENFEEVKTGCNCEECNLLRAYENYKNIT